MITKYNLFLNESKEDGYSISFKDDYGKIKNEAGRKITQILKDNLIGRTIAFTTRNFLTPEFKLGVNTHHSAIMLVEDVIYKPSIADTYTSPYLVKSHRKRDRYIYYDMSPTEKFFFIDSFIDNFNKYLLGEEISFIGNKDADRLTGHYKAPARTTCVPTGIDIVQDAAHQHDFLRITDDKGNKYYILHNSVFPEEKIKKLDPYGEEIW